MPRPTRVSSEALAALAEWLRDHHEVVSSVQLAASGVPRHYATDRVRSGRWQRVHEGVYVAHAGELSHLTRCEAALAALGPEAMLDADSAVVVQGVSRKDFDTKQVHVLLPPHGPRRSLSGVRARYSVDATPASAIERQGLRVRRIEHAVVVMARRRPKGAQGLLTFVVQQGHTTAEKLRGAVLVASRPGGALRMRLVQIIDDIAGGTRSYLEGVYLGAARRGRLPEATRNHPLTIDGRHVWLDLCYPELLIAIEIDGKAYHVLAEDWENDLARQNDLVLAGWLVLRFTARDLRDHPERCIERVRDAIEMRTRRP